MKRKRTKKKQQQESTPHSRKQKQMHRSHECTLARGLMQRRKREKSSIPFRLKREALFFFVCVCFLHFLQQTKPSRARDWPCSVSNLFVTPAAWGTFLRQVRPASLTVLCILFPSKCCSGGRYITFFCFDSSREPCLSPVCSS